METSVYVHPMIKELLAKTAPEEKVFVRGWVRTKRISKVCAFIALNDGSCQNNLQLVVSNTDPLYNKLDKVDTGTCIAATGSLKESPAKGQKWEMHVSELEVLGEVDPTTYPLQKKGHTLEFLREIAHLRPRSNTFGAVFRIRNSLSFSVHEFFQKRGFIWAHTPIITASDAEGAGQMFTVTTLSPTKTPLTPKGEVNYQEDFFGAHSHLTVSGQLEAECLAMALGRVYTFGPTFRAENSNTTRHLSEFWMIEPEVAFADLKDNMALAEDFVRYMLQKLLDNCSEELSFLFEIYKSPNIESLQQVAKATFERLTYTDAVAILQKSKKDFVYPVTWGCDLQTEHERYLTDEVFKGPVIVYNYPKDIKAFYMKMNEDNKTVAAMDVLVPGIGELIGGSQREDRLAFLEKRMDEMKIPKHELAWYLDLRRFGSAPHAGFGLGFERMVMYATGMQNIRDTILSPRAPKTIQF